MRPFLISLSAVAVACSGTDTTDPQVTREPLPVASIVAEMPLSMAIGTSATIKVSLRDTRGQEVNRPVTFASSDSSVATVDANGIITAIRAGSASISVTSEGTSVQSVVYSVKPISTTCQDGFDFCVLNVYDLVSVNGEPLPVKSPCGIGEWDYDEEAGTWVLSLAALTLFQDGSFTMLMAHRSGSGTPLYWEVTGRYADLGAFYLLTGKDAGSWEARINEGMLTVDWGGGLIFKMKARYPD